ncbi:SulP family inorganic anion transporter [Tessaracoccus antarcticus]|uniref:SulP family inorganic anion transporter n=1 Tax=Tessaracoccus antarcticus TaxID=2479848 RepID=UPI0026836376
MSTRGNSPRAERNEPFQEWDAGTSTTSSRRSDTLRHLRGLLPAKDDYRSLPRSWKRDIAAGFTVGIVALPLALAFGVSSGAGAEAGLITAIVAGFIAAVFGGSHVQVSGPTGAMVVVLGPIVAMHGASALAVVCLMAGVMVVLAGVFRLGGLVSVIPRPVIEGFTLGIGVIIFLQQVPSALGSRAGPSNNAVVAAIQSIPGGIDAGLFSALALVGVVAAVMVWLPRLSAQIPASLVAIVVASVGAVLLKLPVATIGQLPPGLPVPSVPSVDPAIIMSLVGPAFAVAILAAIESLLSVRVAATMSDAGNYLPDRELVGQGLATIATGFFGGMPATGAIARTAVNVRSGAKTRVASITHALVLLGVVSFGAAVVSQIPLAALAGVLMVTAARMVSIRRVRHIIRTSRSEAWIFAMTALITVSFDLIYAVGIGIVAAAFFALRAVARTSGVTRERLSGEPQPGDDQIAQFALEGALFFGAADRMLEAIGEVHDIDVVIIRMSGLHLLDSTGAELFTEVITALEARGVTVLVKGLRSRHVELATRIGVVASLRHQEHLFERLDDAVAHARSHIYRLNTFGSAVYQDDGASRLGSQDQLPSSDADDRPVATVSNDGHDNPPANPPGIEEGEQL